MDQSPESYDLIVVGSGPAGEKGAAQSAYFGKRVALVEKEKVLGGAAANTGTLPSKTLRETALYLSGFRNRALYGLDLQVKKEVTVQDFLARELVIKQVERARITENLERHGVDLYKGTATVDDPHTVTVRAEGEPDRRLRGDYLLIATGSHPFRPPGFAFEQERIYDSDEILDLQEIPPSMLVIGGGVIGCEYACMFAVLGVRVMIVERRDRLISSLDAEVARSLRGRMEKLGIRLILSDSVAGVEGGGLGLEQPGGEDYRVRLQSDEVVEAHTILISAGRTGNTAGLGLEAIGVEVNKRGQVVVDEDYRTAVPNVFAAGDVVGNPGLASTAMDQARVATANAFGFEYRPGLPLILPSGIYTIPECSMAGATEEALIEDGIPYVVGLATYAENARGQIIGDPEGFLKLLFREEDMLLLGVHVIGELATEVVHIGLTALMARETADLFVQTCYNYPTLGELYKYATYDALARRSERRREAPTPSAGAGPRAWNAGSNEPG